MTRTIIQGHQSGSPMNRLNGNHCTHNWNSKGRYYNDASYYRRDDSKLRASDPSRPSRKQRSWPPSPSVEDEPEALAREAGPASVSGDDSSDEACSRGSVNQEPIMVEVKLDEKDLRSLHTPSTGSENSKTPSETSGSDSEASRRGRRKIARIDIENDQVPEFVQRKPSPYAFAQNPPKATDRHSGEYLLSPESLISPKTSLRTENLAAYGVATSKSTPSKPQISRAASTSKTASEFARSPGSEDVDEANLSTAEATKLRPKTKSNRYSFTKAELNKKEARVKFSEGEDSGSQTLKFDPRDRPSSIRRSTDAATTLPRIALEAKNSKPRPLQASFANDPEAKRPRPSPLKASFADDLDEAFLRKTGEKRESIYTTGSKDARAVSSAAPRTTPLTPPESPRLKPQRQPDDSPRTTYSRSGSANDPVNNTQPSTPPSSTRTEPAPYITPGQHSSPSDRYATHPQSLKERVRTQSSLSSSMRTDSLPPFASTDSSTAAPKKPSNVSIVLPYPDDNVSMMPNHEDHIYSPSFSRPSPNVPLPRSRSPTLPSNLSDVSRSSKDSSSRPRLPPRHHTFAGGFPQSKDSSRRSVSDNTDKASPVEKTQVHACPRADYSVNYSDWYTLDNCENIDICPDCLEKVFLPSKYGRFFKRAPAKQLGKPRKCDFSSPWMRLAWLLSLREKRDGLDLFAALSEVAADERPCPGDEEEKRSWYSVKDDSKNHVSGFHVCSNCVSNVEALLPSLRGSFTRVHQPEPRSPRKCDLQSKDKHFAFYLDTLIDIDTRARLDRRVPDLRPFVSLIKKDHHKPPPRCAKDNLLLGQRWYFIPQLPELTVCESCYDAVVYPAMKSDHPIAGKFNLKMQLARENSLGTSCQLYSPRMREVWRRATERDDWALLAREARDRKSTEMHLQAKHKTLRIQREDVRRWSQEPHSKEEARLNRELERIAEEWRRWE